MVRLVTTSCLVPFIHRSDITDDVDVGFEIAMSKLLSGPTSIVCRGTKVALADTVLKMGPGRGLEMRTPK
jgi:hypothetical protein